MIDPAGVVRLKLPWCDPSVVRTTLDELAAEPRDPPPVPAERSFLAAIVAQPTVDRDGAAAAHDRCVRLATLALRMPQHTDHRRWLEELAAAGPPQQRQWAERRLRPASDAITK